MTFAIAPFNPIVAFGIVDEKTLTATPAEGSTVMEFDNTGGDALVVGDQVFVRSSDETVLQYRGKATAVTTAQITVQIPLQDAVGASATCWVPTNSVQFAGEMRGSLRFNDDDGAETQISQGGEFFGYQSRDPSATVTMTFGVRNSTAYANWKTFRDTDRRGLIDSFNLAYYDTAERQGKTIKVKGFAGDHPLTTVNWLTTRFSQTFGVEAETPSTGVYVES